MLDASQDTTIRIGIDGRVEYVNRRVVEVSGIPFEQWIGRTFAEIGYPRSRTVLGPSPQRVRHRAPVTFEFEIDNAKGIAGTRPGRPGVDRDGTVAHVIETSRDITERKATRPSSRQAERS